MKIKIRSDYHMPLLLFLVIGIYIFMNLFLDKYKDQSKTDLTNGSLENSNQIDTYIPSGYVLVPIEISNSSSIKGILGQIGGVVDLYSQGVNGKGIKVAEKVKLLKAPYNPDEFAVLVRENDSGVILSQAGPFIAVIQNPNIQKKQNVIKPQKLFKPEISYFN